jgi:hypothetical protein
MRDLIPESPELLPIGIETVEPRSFENSGYRLLRPLLKEGSPFLDARWQDLTSFANEPQRVLQHSLKSGGKEHDGHPSAVHPLSRFLTGYLQQPQCIA